MFESESISLNLTSPLPFLWGTWLIALIICFLDIFTAYPVPSNETVVFVCAFLIGSTVAYHYGIRLQPSQKNIRYTGKRLYRAFNILFTLVVLSYIVTIIRLGLPPLLVGGNRSNYYLSGGGELIYLLIYPCFFLGLFVLYRQSSFNYQRVLSFQLIILFLIILTRGNKMAIFSVILMICFFWGHKVNWSFLIILLALVILIFALLSTIYKRNVSNLNNLKAAKIALTGFSLPDSCYFLYDPMIYLSSNVNNVDSLIQAHMSGLGFGAFSFKGICQLLGIINPEISGLPHQALVMANSTLTVPLFSTYSGLGELYFDFGPVIAIELMMILSFACGYFNESTRSNLSQSFVAFLLYQTLTLSFFTFYLGNLEVITNIFVVLVIDKYARQGMDYE